MLLCVELLESMRGETTDVWPCNGGVELRMCCSEMVRMCLCRFWQSFLLESSGVSCWSVDESWKSARECACACQLLGVCVAC